MKWLRLLFLFITLPTIAQDNIPPGEYTLIQLEVQGASLDDDAIRLMSGLIEGEKITIPADITKTIKKLWKEDIFQDIKISSLRIDKERIWLRLSVELYPRLWELNFQGISRKEERNLREKLDLKPGIFLKPDWKIRMESEIRDHLWESYQTEVTIDGNPLSGVYTASIEIQMERHLQGIQALIGNTVFSTKELERLCSFIKFEKTFRRSKPVKKCGEKIEKDTEAIREHYRQNGYKNVELIVFWDEVEQAEEPVYDLYKIRLEIREGEKYVLGNMAWSGNTIYTSDQLSEQSALKPGMPFNLNEIQSRLSNSIEENDAASLYLDAGYMNARFDVKEHYRGDTIDLNIRVIEGEIVTISKISIEGNVRTNDAVILRELTTRPGDVFTRQSLRRSLHKLRQMEMFVPDSVNVRMEQEQATNTVHIIYHVKEIINDKLNLQLSYGGERLYGTLGFNFTNFSMRNLFKGPEWKPTPAGDAQRFSLAWQSDSRTFNAFNINFSEPWFLGKSPTAFNIGSYYSNRHSGDTTRLEVLGGSISFGLKPFKNDDDTYFQTGVNFTHYSFQNDQQYGYPDGPLSNLSWTNTIARNTTNDRIYPTQGHFIKLDIRTSLPVDRSDWLASYKSKFQTSWFTPLSGNSKLVLMTKVGFGATGVYKGLNALPTPDRFLMGGSGFFTTPAEPLDLIGLRGYPDGDISNPEGDVAVAKYSIELRYLLWKKPKTTGWIHGFAEAGNSWSAIGAFNPLDLKRSAGFGLRVLLPMVGMVGFDYGLGFDVPNHESPIHSAGDWVPSFTIGFDLGKL